MKDTISIDVAIIGGGVVGLLTGLELKKLKPTWEIAILEQAPFLADHSTGRNSGVLHSGLYYETGSLKHKLCLEGLEAWKKLILEHSIPHLWCGKTIFAHSVDEIPRLNELAKKAQTNSVPYHQASALELQETNRFVAAVDALIIESTGILDVAEAMKIFEREFENLGGIIQTSTQVKGVGRSQAGFHIITPEFDINSSQLINAAGLWAPEIRAQLGLIDMKSRFVKGHYLKTSQKLEYSTLYYPVPPSDLKGLGVHSTIDCNLDVKFGPDTLDVESINYKLEPANLEAMRLSIAERFKGVDTSRLMPDYAGIRSKIEVGGKLHQDFWIKGPQELSIPGYAEACGIESPGMTSAPAIARMLGSHILQ